MMIMTMIELSFLTARWANKEEGNPDDEDFEFPLLLLLYLARLVNGEF